MKLAEILYAEFRTKQTDPTALPAWGNLGAVERGPWEAVEAKARAVVTEENAHKLGNAVVDQLYRQDEAVGCAWAAQHLRGKV